ncbi:PadR family transcriptional regulator [Arthrobacter rhizosphaerae]|uniref:PadR family transcriptional regulator n=1 Tax=Arthrobacter rhizosphaerae TaxID=2855490 RepID=UPI003558BBC5
MNEDSVDFSSQLRRGVVGPCILALLSEEPGYGLSLVRRLDSAGGLLTSHGTIYPALDRLEKASLVESDWDTTTGSRPRRLYRITKAGIEELERFRTEWHRFSDSVESLMTRS